MVATGLSVGTYQCVVTDANGCTISDFITLTEPDELILNDLITDASCYDLMMDLLIFLLLEE